ncbi:MAG TPA: DUF1223 domain-containing protein [Caulobacteraceae bacterium]|jgi:hypothetical protein
MRISACTASTIALALGAVSPAAGGDRAHPTVVELFQSQGCSSCPPANANLLTVAGRADVLALSFGVTYWDQLGWKDTFAQPSFTARQWDYAHRLSRASVFTPETIVNGRADGVGADPAEFHGLLARGDRGAGGPALAATGGQVTVGRGPAPREGADIWLVRYDPHVVQVAIKRGENGGRTLPHRNVVRALIRLGVWRGAPVTLPLPAAAPDLDQAILVQAAHGGPILAAARA